MGFLVIKAVDVFFDVVYYILLARILLSWFPGARHTSIGVFLFNMTEPILLPFRNIVDKSPIGRGSMIDFSPILAFFVMGIVERFIINILAMVIF